VVETSRDAERDAELAAEPDVLEPPTRESDGAQIWLAPAEEVTTLEALARTAASDGFATYEPHAGDLAALAGDSNDHTSGVDGVVGAAGMEAQVDARFDEQAFPAPYDVTTTAAAPEPSGGNGSEAGALDGPEDEAQLRQARALRAQGQLDEALDLYGQLLHQSPALLEDVTRDLQAIVAGSDTPAAHRLLGDALIRGGNYQQALAAYNQANTTSQSQDG
jgi:tetratricopeptide (TPR) repeat protein